jgi:hypothetical protein
MGRSRSWVLTEALGRYLKPAAARAVGGREPRATYEAGLGSGRQAQLEADLALTPEERVLIAEQTALIADLRGRRPARDQVISFERFEDFLDWKRREALGP